MPANGSSSSTNLFKPVQKPVLPANRRCERRGDRRFGRMRHIVMIFIFIQISEDGQSWQGSRREDSKGSSECGMGMGEAWEFRSALEAPIARLESLDELEGIQVSAP